MATAAADADPLAKYRQFVTSSARSLLVPYKDGLVLKAFEQEYLAMCGEPIDHGRLGFASLLELLRSMPDVVAVMNLGGGDFLLRAVASANSAHIQDMVRKQKPSDSGYNKMARNKMQQFRRQATTTTTYGHQKPLAKVTSPETLRQEVLSVMKVNRQGLSGKAFYPAFNRHYGRGLDFASLGFQSLRGLLLTLADVVQVRAVGNDFIVTPTAKCLSQWNEEDMRKNGPAFVQPGPTQKPPQRDNIMTFRATAAVDSSTSSSDSNAQLEDVLHEAAAAAADQFTARRVDEGGDSAPSHLMIPPMLKTNLQNLIANYPKGLSIYELPKKFQAIHGHEFDYQRHGCNSLSEFCLLLPNVFRTRKSDGGHFYVYPLHVAGNGIEEEPPVDGAAQGSEDLDSASSVGELPQHSDQVRARDPPGEDANCSALDVTRFGFEHLREFLDSIDFIVVEQSIVKIRPGAILPVAAATENLACDPFQSRFGRPERPVPADAVKWNSEDGPMDAVVFPVDSRKEIYEIIVQEIYDPGKFYFNLKGRDTSEALDDLMFEMNHFYDGPEGDLFRMGSLSSLVGHYCAAQYNDEWTRAVVKKLKDLDTVLVLFFDYGTSKAVLVDGLRYLHRNFCRLPSQAILGRNASILPRDGKWTVETSLKFKSLATDERGLVAYYRGTRVLKETYISLLLCNTRGDDDIWVHDELVQMGGAVADENYEETNTFQINPLAKLKASGRVHNIQPIRIPTSVAARRDYDGSSRQIANVQPMTQEVAEFSRLPPSSPACGPLTAATSQGQLSVGGFGLPNFPTAFGMGAAVPPVLQQHPFAPSAMMFGGAQGLLPVAPQCLARPPPGFGDINMSYPGLRQPLNGHLLAGQQSLNVSLQSVVSVANDSLRSRRVVIVASGKSLIRLVDLCPGVQIHVINICGDPFVVSLEVSLLFPKWRKRDLLAKMVALKRQRFDTVLVDQESGAELFAQALCECVPGFEDVNSDKMVESVTLYHLSDLTILIKTHMTSPDESLLKAVEDVIGTIDRQGESFWSRSVE